MFRTIDDFQRDWRYESDATLKMLRNLTDSALDQRVSPEGRTLGRIAWHLVQSITEFGSQASLEVSGPDAKAPIPLAEEIAQRYEHSANSIGQSVSASWNDAMLPEEIEVFGERWPRGFLLASLIRHQAHHRGQMSVLMRQAGLSVPGVYGPAREEWSAFGREPEE